MPVSEYNGDTPEVSVVIATYNRADRIRWAIESVLAQSFTRFELIIADDGSTDDTRAVVSAYQDARIIYLPLEHGERSRARNAGIAISRGRYMAFLDSDDWYLPNKLADQVATLQAAPENGLALGGWRIEDETGQLIQEVRPWESLSSPPTLYEWLVGTTLTPITILVKKEWLEKVGGFDEALSYSEDIDLAIRLRLAGCPVVFTRSLVAAVLVHPFNSLRQWSRLREAWFKYLDKLFANKQFALNLGRERPEIYAAFHLALAWRAYDAGLLQEGQDELLQALDLNPDLEARRGQAIVDSLIGYTNYFLVKDPIRVVRLALENLPERLAFLSEQRRQILGQAWMSRAWRASQNKNFPLMKHSVWRAVWYQPGCLGNRGIRSMLFQALVGQQIWQFIRSAGR